MKNILIILLIIASTIIIWVSYKNGFYDLTREIQQKPQIQLENIKKPEIQSENPTKPVNTEKPADFIETHGVSEADYKKHMDNVELLKADLIKHPKDYLLLMRIGDLLNLIKTKKLNALQYYVKAYDIVSSLLNKSRMNEEITPEDHPNFINPKDLDKALKEDFLLETETTLGKKLGYEKINIEKLKMAPIFVKPELREECDGIIDVFGDRYLSLEKGRQLKIRIIEIRKISEEYNKLIESDDYEFAVHQAISNLQAFPGTKGKKFEKVKCRPFVIFIEKGVPAINEGIFKDQINITRDMIVQHSALFKKEIVEKYNLKYDPKKALIVVCFKDRSSFNDYCRKNDIPVYGGMLSFYHKITECVYINNDTGLMKRKSRLNTYLSILAHEITHQQFSYYINSSHKDRLNYRTKKYLHAWLNEGMAEYFAQLDYDKRPDGKYMFKFWRTPKKERCVQLCTALYPHKYGFGKSIQRAFKIKVKNWHFTVKEMVQYGRNYNTAMDYFLRKLRKDQPGLYSALARRGAHRQIASVGMGLIYCQGLTFIHFCFAYKNGKYESAFRKFLGYQCTDNHDWKLFAQCFNMKTEADWKNLNKDYLKYIWYEVIVKHGYDK